MAKVKQKKWYAIKEGKGVTNIIVTSWKECSELVLGYNSIYKSFKTEEEALIYLGSITDSEVPRIKEKRKKLIEKDKKRKATTKPLNGIRVPVGLYEIIEVKSERDHVEIEKLIIDALQMVFE